MCRLDIKDFSFNLNEPKPNLIFRILNLLTGFSVSGFSVSLITTVHGAVDPNTDPLIPPEVPVVPNNINAPPVPGAAGLQGDGAELGINFHLPANYNFNNNLNINNQNFGNEIHIPPNHNLGINNRLAPTSSINQINISNTNANPNMRQDSFFSQNNPWIQSLIQQNPLGGSINVGNNGSTINLNFNGSIDNLLNNSNTNSINNIMTSNKEEIIKETIIEVFF